LEHQKKHDEKVNFHRGITREKMVQRFEKRKSVGNFVVGTRVLVRNPKLEKMHKKPKNYST